MFSIASPMKYLKKQNPTGEKLDWDAGILSKSLLLKTCTFYSVLHLSVYKNRIMLVKDAQEVSLSRPLIVLVWWFAFNFWVFSFCLPLMLKRKYHIFHVKKLFYAEHCISSILICYLTSEEMDLLRCTTPPCF